MCSSDLDDGAERTTQTTLVDDHREPRNHLATQQTTNPVGGGIRRQPHPFAQHLPRDSGVLFQNTEYFTVYRINDFGFVGHNATLGLKSAVFAAHHSLS